MDRVSNKKESFSRERYNFSRFSVKKVDLKKARFPPLDRLSSNN